jgi:tetratricopeptide (TPR) repeat protein
MPISSCQPVSLTCDECKAKYTFEVWFIVDVNERPDLLAACRDGTIDTASCPNGHVVYVGSPLLIHDPARKLVIVSPFRSPTSPAEERQMVTSLMNRLHNSVPAAIAHEDYLKRAKSVKRADLPRELSRPLEAAGPQDAPDDEFLNLFSRLSRPVDVDELPGQIKLCEEALRRYSGAEHEQARGWLYAKLGTFLANCKSGDQAENLERSIEARKSALTVYTKDKVPVEWAGLQVNLGNVYARRLRGSRAENIALAAEAYRNALTVFTRKPYPKEWEKAQANLKAMLAEEAAPDTSLRSPFRIGPVESGPSLMTQIDEAMATGDMPRLVKLCTLMLQIVRPETHAHQWAELQFALGYGLVNSPEGELASNVERAAEAFAAALRYARGPAGLERIIEIYKAALTVHRFNTAPKGWAAIQFNLGLAYTARADMATDERADEVRESSLKLAVEAYRAALKVRTRDRLPFEWACTLVNLGLTYRKSGGLEESRHALESALSFLTRQDHSMEWAIAQYNLGATYRRRLEGDRPENQDRAIAAFENALQVFTREQFVSEWTEVQIGLGNVYREREQGDRGDNSSKAVRAYEAALTVVDRAARPRLWAELQTLRGNSYVELDYAEEHPETARAVEAYEAALTVLTPENTPELWGDAQNNLASFLIGWQGGDRAENIERAIKAYHAVSAVRTPSDFEREYRFGRNPGEVIQRALDWVSLQINLGSAYELRVRGERAENLRRARAAYEAALEVCRVGFGTDVARNAAASLGRVRAELQDWKGAFAAFRTSLQATGREFNFALTEGRKQRTIEQNAWLYEEGVESCLRMNPPRPADAFIFAEEARSRIFRYQLSELPLRPPRGAAGEVVFVEQQLSRRMRELQEEINRTDAGEGRWRLIDEATETREKLRKVWDTLRHKHKAADYLALRGDEELLRWEDFREWFGGAA